MATELQDNDYILAEGAAWFTVRKFAIRIHATDEGVVVDVYGLDRESHGTVATTFAFDHEVEDEEEMQDDAN